MDKAVPDEQGRLTALLSYAILDTPAEPEFDALTRLAAHLCATPMATVTLVDGRRQWFKSVVGLDITETDRAFAFCAHAIGGAGLFVVPDARKHPLFAHNPLVTGAPGLRFYTGMPLVSPDGFALGTLAVMDRVPRTLSADQAEMLRTLASQVVALLERRRQRRLFDEAAEENAARSGRLARAGTDAAGQPAGLARGKLHKAAMQLLEFTGEGIWAIDMSGRCTYANGAAARMLGYDVEEMLGRPMHELVHHRHADGAAYPAAQCPIVQACQTGLSAHRDDEVFWRKDNTSCPVKYVSYPLVDGGSIAGSLVTFSDITERHQARLEIMRINRALQMRNACNELLIRATDETELLTNVCRLALDIGGYRTAWAGYVQGDDAGSIALVAHAGGDADFIDHIRTGLAAQDLGCRGPAYETTSKGAATVLEDLGSSAGSYPCVARARDQGYRGLICLPLRDNASTFGLIALYSLEARPIPAEEIKLLQALADDLAFGIGILRAQEQQRRIQAAVAKVAAGVSATSGAQFFEQLARSMAEAVGAQSAFIARFAAGDPLTPRTIVAVVDGAVERRFDRVIEAIACKQLFGEDKYTVCGGAGQADRAGLLSAFGGAAYAGGRLDGSDGAPVGLFFVLFATCLPDSELIRPTLQIFGARAAAELERITQRQAAEDEIRHLAFYDPLTRLPNRQLLLDRLQHALAMSARGRSTGALLLIDLDNFKALNDTRGHETGDQLLQQVALRLTASLRNSDTVARLGGDEFVVMLEDLGQNPHEAAAHARGVGETILSVLNQPYHLGGHQQFSSPSIGVTLFNEHDADIGELLKRAEIAMYQAKAGGRNTLRFFDPAMQMAADARALLEADLRHGLQNKEFLLHYQPQVDGRGDPTGAEALVRWRQPRRGLVPPGEFIAVAEETGLIIPLGEWVLESACARLAGWAARAKTATLTMSVNVSARQFRHPGFIDQVLGVLAHTGANPYRLKLELTEGLLIDDVEATIAIMMALKGHGVGFSLDDFGTGYSSLAYLKRLPLDQLKIDQSFVRDVLTDANDATIARTIVNLGQSLGLAVIAEGVETEAQRNLLASHNCDAFQGYLFSRPLPADQFDAFVMAHRRGAAARRPVVGTRQDGAPGVIETAEYKTKRASRDHFW